jgi:PHD/YefM family antitoxin component YafN of YafNO toxin-antitoxin module
MRGRRHRYHRTGSVAKAIMADRASQQTTESDVFAGADHQKLRVLRSTHKNLACIPAHEFQHPIPMR